jgi:hypothetical protein
MPLDPEVVKVLLSVKEDTGFMRGQMAGYLSRIEQLEKREETKETRNWIRSFVVAPIVLAIQYALRTFGAHV